MKGKLILQKLINFHNTFKKEELSEFTIDIDDFNSIKEAIKELEELENIKNTVIEEIEYAIAKPEYANVYLNNALRFLRNK